MQIGLQADPTSSILPFANPLKHLGPFLAPKVLYNGQILTLTNYFGGPCLFINNPSQISIPKMQFVGGYPNEYCIYIKDLTCL